MNPAPLVGVSSGSLKDYRHGVPATGVPVCVKRGDPLHQHNYLPQDWDNLGKGGYRYDWFDAL
jgi:hypothetical protein